MTRILHTLLAVGLGGTLWTAAGCSGAPYVPPPPVEGTVPDRVWNQPVGDDRFGADMSARSWADFYGDEDHSVNLVDALSVRLRLLGETLEAAELSTDLQIIPVYLLGEDTFDTATGGWCRTFGTDHGRLTAFSGDFATLETRHLRPVETLRLGSETIELGFDVTVMADVRRTQANMVPVDSYDDPIIDSDTSVQIAVRAVLHSTSGTLLEQRFVGPNLVSQGHTRVGNSITRNVRIYSQVRALLIVGTSAGEAAEILADYGADSVAPVVILDDYIPWDGPLW